MDPPLVPPIAPMLARLSRALPRDGYLYEPKWDGFRCLAFRSDREVDLRSRNQRPLARYFPELVEALLLLPSGGFVLDGEIVVAGPSGLEFAALMSRLHPAASRVRRLRVETPATLIAFDLLGMDARDLRERPFEHRRRLLEQMVPRATRSIALTPITDDPELAASWLERFQGNGVDGVVAKHRQLRYESGTRAMVKVKTERTADCVVAGFRWLWDRPVVGSLLLGLYDQDGSLRHVGVTTAFSQETRTKLRDDLAPLVVPLEGHPWEHGFGIGRSPVGRLLGAAGRWVPEEMDRDWIPVRPELVCEVGYDQVDDRRLRHQARFRRWRPDRNPRSCGLDQLHAEAPLPVEVRSLW